MNKRSGFFALLYSLSYLAVFTHAQIEERARPESWNQLAPGGRFADRFLPMKGKELSSDTWGADGVVPRFVDNGMEDRIWSYWGGNIVRGEDGKYHLMACGWLECSEKGHYEWGNSYAFNAIGDEVDGPFKVRNVIGKGHNPEVYQLKDGRWVLYVIDGYYVSDDLNGTWEYGKFEFDARDRPIIEGLSNLSFVSRQDGSFLMVCRGGGIWVSEDGISGWKQITDKRVYPPVDGRFEDPVIWKDDLQYHLIVNDWLGRIAFYLRSKNGVDWVVDPGEAYMPGIAVHDDSLVEDWFKFERIKVFQDEFGRAIQANFAVIDTFKWEDKSADNHSSKNICIPLNPGLLLKVLNEEPIDSNTGQIRLLIKAESQFDPVSQVDIDSLRFGASNVVNFGGGCKVLSTEALGSDLMVVFDGAESGLTEDEFAGKLMGKSREGEMLFGFVKLPGIAYEEAIVSARKPQFKETAGAWTCEVVVENFGIKPSDKLTLEIQCLDAGKSEAAVIATAAVPVLDPYQEVSLSIPCGKQAKPMDFGDIDLKVVFSKDGDSIRSETFKAPGKEE